MLKGTIIADTDTDTDVVRSALQRAGCTSVATLSSNHVGHLSRDSTSRPDVVVAIAQTMRVLNRLVAFEAPIVAICPEPQIDASFLAGASECVALPLRPRELEGRIRHALRVSGQSQFRRSRERRMADMIADLERARSGLEQQLCIDALTEVATRRHALAMLDAECRRSMRDQKPLGLVMIDIDCFHAYNARYGHVAGDRCLKWVSAAMSRCLRRPSDFIGRYGGEEFVAVLPNTDLAGTRYVAEAMRAAVEAVAIPHAASVCSPVVTITAGFTSASITVGLTPEDIVGAADTALMHAKAGGRNQCRASYEQEGGTPTVAIGRATTARVAASTEGAA